MHFAELRAFLGTIKPTGRSADAGPADRQRDPRRLELLLAIGLDYLSLNRRSGDALGRRIAAHPAVVADRLGADGHAVRARRAEHRPAPEGQRQDDRDAPAPARPGQHGDRRRARRGHDSRGGPCRRDGPGPGVHGGTVVVQGTLDRSLDCKASPTGQYLSGKRSIANARANAARPAARRSSSAVRARTISRTSTSRSRWTVRLRHRRVRVGKEHARSTRSVQDAVQAALRHPRPAGEHDGSTASNTSATSSTSTSRRSAATARLESGDLHRLLRRHPHALCRDRRSQGARLQAGRFSFNVKGGRCEECPGEGTITTQL